jgi:hypothetical protein
VKVKLDRNINGTGRGKYGLLLARKLTAIESAAPGVGPDPIAVRDAIAVLEHAGVIEWGNPNTASEFFVIKLRDINSRAAIDAYADSADSYGKRGADPHPLAHSSRPRNKGEVNVTNRFKITWEHGAYHVNIPRYQGGEVVPAHVADVMMKALKPFAELADVCDHFSHTDSRRMCKVTIGGIPQDGPTAGDCRAARAAILAATPSKGE